MSPTAAVRSHQLRRLHVGAIDDSARIRAIVEEAHRRRLVFRAGMNKRILPERAWLEAIVGSDLEFKIENFERATHSSFGSSWRG